MLSDHLKCSRLRSNNKTREALMGFQIKAKDLSIQAIQIKKRKILIIGKIEKIN
jgi:hypothetical protein